MKSKSCWLSPVIQASLQVITPESPYSHSCLFCGNWSTWCRAHHLGIPSSLPPISGTSFLPGIRDDPCSSHPLHLMQDQRASTSPPMQRITMPFQSMGALNLGCDGKGLLHSGEHLGCGPTGKVLWGGDAFSPSEAHVSLEDQQGSLSLFY